MTNKEKMMREGYVYTIDAVRMRLHRGAKSVLLFVPGCGRLVKVTKSNYKQVREAFNMPKKISTR